MEKIYILGPEGTAENYPTDYVLGENGTAIVGVVNHECKPVNYTMEVWLENESLPLPADQKNIFLGNNETWEKAGQCANFSVKSRISRSY